MNIKHAKFKAQVRLLQAAPYLLATLKNILIMTNTSGDKMIALEAKEAIEKAEGK